MDEAKQHEPGAQGDAGIDHAGYGPEELGKCLRDARKKCGFSQREIALLINRSTVTIRRYESGSKRPSRQSFENLISALSSAFIDQENLLEKSSQRFGYIADPDRVKIDFTTYDSNRLCDLIRDARNYLVLTQAELAKNSKVSRDTVKRIEKGETSTETEGLAAILMQLRSAFSPNIDFPRDILLHFGHRYFKPGQYLDLHDYSPDHLDELIGDTCGYLGHSPYELPKLARIRYSRITSIMMGERPPPDVARKLSNVLVQAFAPGTPIEGVFACLGCETHTIDLGDYGHDDLGKLLRDARGLLGYRLAGFSRELEVSPRAVISIEKNETRPRLEVIEKILSILAPAFLKDTNLPEQALLKFGYPVEGYVQFSGKGIHSLGERLTALRRLSQQTLTDLGRLTDIPPPRIYAIEQNRLPASAIETAKLSRILARVLQGDTQETTQWLSGDISELALPRLLVKWMTASYLARPLLADSRRMTGQQPLGFGLTLRQLREETGISVEQASGALQDSTDMLDSLDGEQAKALLAEMETGGGYGRSPTQPSASYLRSVGLLLNYYRDLGIDINAARNQVATWWIAKHEQRLPRLMGRDAIAAKIALFLCQQEQRSPSQIAEQATALEISDEALANARAGAVLEPGSAKILKLHEADEPTRQSGLREELRGEITNAFAQRLIRTSLEPAESSQFRQSRELREAWRRSGDTLLRWRLSATDNGAAVESKSEEQRQLGIASQRTGIPAETLSQIERGKGYLYLDMVEMLAKRGDVFKKDSGGVILLCRRESESREQKKYDSLFVYDSGDPTQWQIDIERYLREIHVVIPETGILELPHSEASARLQYLIQLQNTCISSKRLPHMNLQILPEDACGYFPHYIHAVKGSGDHRYSAIGSSGQKIIWYLEGTVDNDKLDSNVEPDEYIYGIFSNSFPPEGTTGHLQNLLGLRAPMSSRSADPSSRLSPPMPDWRGQVHGARPVPGKPRL